MDIINDACEGPSEFSETMPNEEYVQLLKDCNQELYEGCQKYSKSSFLLRLYHISYSTIYHLPTPSFS